jgi:hypothetical protein
MDSNYEFPKTINSDKWKLYLERRLTNKELHILGNVRSEARMNDKIDSLYDKCELLDPKLYIPSLTELVGNCLFESLNYHNICSSVENLREGLAYVMYQFKDYKNFFPGQAETLNELFVCFNDIEYVFCNDDKKLYKYNYDIMCQDLADDRSWSKLPTQLILMVVSYIFKIKIDIINSDTKVSWVNTIDIHKENSTNTIQIGHISESHYVPLDILGDDEDIVRIHYSVCKNRFIKWAKKNKKLKIKLIQEKQQQQQIETVKNEGFCNLGNANETDIVNFG